MLHIWFRNLSAAQSHGRTAKRLEPAADVDLRVALAAEMQRMRFVGLSVIPFEDSQVGIAAMDDKPAHGRRTLQATNLTLVIRTDQDGPPAKLGTAPV